MPTWHFYLTFILESTNVILFISIYILIQSEAFNLKFMITSRLNSIDEHVKNYAPKILALTGPPSARPALIHLANLITKNNSLLIAGEVYPVLYQFNNITLHLFVIVYVIKL